MSLARMQRLTGSNKNYGCGALLFLQRKVFLQQPLKLQEQMCRAKYKYMRCMHNPKNKLSVEAGDKNLYIDIFVLRVKTETLPIMHLALCSTCCSDMQMIARCYIRFS